MVKEQIKSILISRIDKRLVADLVNSYEGVKDAHIKGDDETALSRSGKFVENVFRVLKFLKSNQFVNEIKQRQFEEISADLLNADSTKFSDSIRILIPRIALSLIYEPRSKLGAIHVKDINPDFIDSKLVVGACDWIMAEFLRLYHTRDTEIVKELIEKVVKDYIPIIKKIGEETFIDAPVDCREEILIRLSDADGGLTRADLGSSMKYHFAPSTITNTLQKLTDDRDVFFTRDEKYVISDSARKTISRRIIELSNRTTGMDKSMQEK